MAKKLSAWRDKIDAIDAELLRLLNQRAECVIEIGKFKRKENLPIYDPRREAEVIAHVTGLSRGPLEAKAVARLFERIIDESRRVERLASEEKSQSR